MDAENAPLQAANEAASRLTRGRTRRTTWLRNPTTGSKGSSGTTASWCPGRTPSCMCCPRPALRQLRVRGRARLWRQDLQDHRARRAAEEVGPGARLRDPLFGRRDRRRQATGRRQERPEGRLCPPGRLARLGDDGRLGAEQHHPPRHRLLGMAELFRSGAAAQGHQARPRRISPARSEDARRASPRRPAST